jgi:hypothetical protein
MKEPKPLEQNTKPIFFKSMGFEFPFYHLLVMDAQRGCLQWIFSLQVILIDDGLSLDVPLTRCFLPLQYFFETEPIVTRCHLADIFQGHFKGHETDKNCGKQHQGP